MFGGSSKRMKESTFWLIATPNSATGPHGMDTLKTKLRSSCEFIQRFAIPNLRVGTLDSLMALSDELSKKDSFVEQLTKKIARQLTDLYSEDEPENQEDMQLLVNGVNLDTFLHHFQWDEGRYKISSPLSDIIDNIVASISKLDEELKTKSSNYQSLTHTLAADKRKQTGNLMVKDLASVIKPEYVVESANLTTIFVVVPKHQAREWEKSYENFLSDDNLGGGVVPGSSNLIETDSDFSLYSVVIFKRLVDDYKQAVRFNKYTVRDVNLDVDALASGQEEQKDTEHKRAKQKKGLIRWCRLNFTEAFVAWTHLKTIRLFVESILRYGLPVDFTAVLIEPLHSQEKKVRSALDQLYKGLGSEYLLDSESDAMPSVLGTTEKFYSYVWTEIKMSLY